ncbi:HIT family protein [Streptomyces albidoflavus]|uniref:HIT family protein n=1 Tax=Streptomyces albidoflavus TaxID=1886 RepID=UPI0035DABAB4
MSGAFCRRMREAGAQLQVAHRHINRSPAPPREPPRPDCPFCRIIHDGAPATIVHEWSDALAIEPRSGGCTDGHILVLPRRHVADFTTDPVVSATVQMRATELAAQTVFHATSFPHRRRRPRPALNPPTPPRSPPDEVPLLPSLRERPLRPLP